MPPNTQATTGSRYARVSIGQLKAAREAGIRADLLPPDLVAIILRTALVHGAHAATYRLTLRVQAPSVVTSSVTIVPSLSRTRIASLPQSRHHEYAGFLGHLEHEIAPRVLHETARKLASAFGATLEPARHPAARHRALRPYQPYGPWHGLPREGSYDRRLRATTTLNDLTVSFPAGVQRLLECFPYPSPETVFYYRKNT
jgi:hypothetical protein